MKKIAVVLSGCGYLDGTEITEAVSILIALSEFATEAHCFAPDLEVPMVSHLSLTKTAKSDSPSDRKNEMRNVLLESARLARGQVRPLTDLREVDYDALVFPGGFGAANTLCNWAEVGSQARLIDGLRRVIEDFHSAAKPIAATCIAPVLLAKALGREQVTITIGNDPETIREIEKTGALHATCPVQDYVSDRDHKILTTPSYMLEAKPNEIFSGIRKMIRELVEMA